MIGVEWHCSEVLAGRRGMFFALASPGAWGKGVTVLVLGFTGSALVGPVLLPVLSAVTSCGCTGGTGGFSLDWTRRDFRLI